MIRFHVTFLDGRVQDYTIHSATAGHDIVGRPFIQLFMGPQGPERVLFLNEMDNWEISVIAAVASC